jgi:CyaY protein
LKGKKMAVQLSDQEYNRCVEQTMQGLQGTLDRYPDLLDWETHGDILYIRFEDGETVVINKQPPLHQLWFASQEGGKQFEWQGDGWIDVRSGESWSVVVQGLLNRKGLKT